VSKSNIKAAFAATGIWPQDQTVVLKKFKPRTPPNQTNLVDVSHLSPANWRHTEQLLEQLVVDQTDERFKKLERAIHRASTETKLLRHENAGLVASLDTQNKRISHSRRLPVGGSKKQSTDAAWHSPRRLEKERREITMKDNAKVAQKAADNTKQELQKAKKILDQKDKKARQAAAKATREMKEAQKAEREAEKQRRREGRDRQKALKTSQSNMRKALKALSKPKKKQRRVGGAVGGLVEGAASPAPLPPTKSGRTRTHPAKLR
jgi:hypothetical protein